jgi:hypothetical protein
MWTRRTGDALGAVGVNAAFFADDIIKKFGGLSDYQTAVSKFYDDFFTAEEKVTNRTNELTIAFTRLGISVPASMTAFKDLVLAQDLSTASGRNFYTELLKLAPAFSDVAKAAEDAFKQIGDSLTAEIRRIRGELTDTDSRGLAYLQSEFAIATAAAKAGDADAAKQLPALSKAMLDLAASQSKSLVELQRLQGYTVASLLETRAYLASKYGIEVPAFANGGVFTNGVVSSPTLFNMGLMGEDGPEAVMPLTRVGGKLGVRTAGDSRSSSELVREIRMLRAEVRAVVTHTSKSAKILARVSQDGESLSVSFSPDGEPFPVVVQE